jgi:hypothetical protein
VQLAPQSMPEGEEKTTPVPAPALETVIDGGPDGDVEEVPKAAPTLRATLIVTLQAPVPVQAPLQPRKVEPLAGVAVSDTVVVEGKLAPQVAPQLIPAGELVTVPLPVPLFVTVSAFGAAAKVAVAFRAELTVSVQVEAPVQAPPQPVKDEPVLGVAVSVTTVPAVKLLVQVVPQFKPAGEEVTTPVPVPVLTIEIDGCGIWAKLAVTLRAALIATLHELAVPLQEPLHPAKVEPVPGVAVRVTVASCAKLALQVAPQLMPVGALVTVPVPAPLRLTLRA